jgi:excisionase family DNA binding protein
LNFETADKAAERLGVTVRAIQKWAKEGKIPNCYKLGRDWMIPKDAVKPIGKREKKEQSTRSASMLSAAEAWSVNIPLFLPETTKRLPFPTAQEAVTCLRRVQSVPLFGLRIRKKASTPWQM